MRLLRCACRQVPVCCLLFTVLKMASQIISDPEHVIDRVCWYPVQPTVVLLVSKLRIFPLDLSEVRVPCSLSVIYRTLLLFVCDACTVWAVQILFVDGWRRCRLRR
jgi:hypothetical protein